jgi:hypothetical protein
MDGSTLGIIMIPFVIVISLAAWLIVVFYAARHPQWKTRSLSRPVGPASVIPLPRPDPGYQRGAADAAHPSGAAAAARTDAGRPAA